MAGPELSRVNSTAAADDLDALRAALGQQTLTLIGQGYGGTLAAVYADRYPARVGAAVIDAPTDPLDALDVRAAAIAVAAEKAVDTFAASCADFQGGCPLGADPRAEIDKAVSALDDGPGADPGSGITNGGSVLLALLLRLGDPAGWPALATALAAAADGNGQPIQDLLDASLGLDSRLRLAERRDHLRLQRQLAAHLAAADVDGGRGDPAAGTAARPVHGRPGRAVQFLAGTGSRARRGEGDRRGADPGAGRGRRPDRAVRGGPVAGRSARFRDGCSAGSPASTAATRTAPA